MPELREDIKSALQSLISQPLRQASLSLLATLGYRSDRTLILEGSKPQAFLDLVQSQGGSKFDPEKACFSDWKSADILFQLTDEDLAASSSLFKETDIKSGLLRSYLFFAIELKGGDHSRSKLSAIARQINRVFPMPVMVLLKHDRCLSIAVINRRQNKLHADKDVLEKVTLIRDISLIAPHRGHLEILQSIAFSELEHPKKLPIRDFDTLHAAWEQIFNIELLNNRFYKELSNWYFWAVDQVNFPDDLEKDDDKRRATGLIRLLTRLIFCWFLKEKDGLIPSKLFDKEELEKILKGFDPESETSSTYYLAILQNLFFATLNQRMGKDSKGNPYRVFAKDEGFLKNKSTYDVNNLYRYENLFAVPEEEALALFADIPFLNGGLFECLDRTEESSPDNPVGASSNRDKIVTSTFKKRYLDGFSRNPKKRPHVPDRLFFDSGETADLSAAYGDKKRKSEKVTGLISILNRYKFTIVENTPIDQEIALDPELLGKVFENLLASYNEETKTTARKQTGSFYTPRPIVDYMVDESLKAHLERKVAETILSRSSEINSDKLVEATLKPFNPDAPTKKKRANLPHWSQEGSTYWITFRLADSLPLEKLKAWKAERDIWASHRSEPWSDSDWKEYHERFGERMESWLDAGSGECVLRRPEIRSMVEKCLTRFDGDHYDLGPWVIMPNHVHLLLRPREGYKLSKILQGIKGVSAKECNEILERTGQPFWQEESFDHIVRSQAQFDRFVRYISENPVKAKLKDGDYSKSSRGNPAPESNQTQRCSDNPVAVSSDQTGTGLSRLRSRLDLLFTYTEDLPDFSELEKATLIAAIDEVKILDPACGSGAFPMGVLHKLVYILGKLDPDNERWKQTQLAKLDSAPMREALEATFADNNDDYGRKLYLIENCLYGVDIQPIAIQITKLRFFISLVCDQKTNRNKKDNHGIRPLPNLETKFVAANTLIGLPEMDQMELIDPRVYKIEAEIEALYHSHFSIQRRDQKLAVQGKLKDLRKEMANVLAQSLMSRKKSEHIADWNPFDPQSSADFFDPHWMFGKSLAKGFDVVIGNPPYVNIEKISISDRERYLKTFGEDGKLGKRYDLYQLFIMRGMGNLSAAGLLTFILPNTFLMGSSYLLLRRKICQQTSIVEVTDLPQGVFDNATVDNVVILLRRECLAENTVHINKLNTRSSLNRVTERDWDDAFSIKQSTINATTDFKINVHTNHGLKAIFDKLVAQSICLGDVTASSQGIIVYKTKEDSELDRYTSRSAKAGWKKLLRGTNIGLYCVKWGGEYLHYGDWLWCARDQRYFEEPKILLQAMRNKGLKRRLVGVYDDQQHYNAHNLANIIALKNSGYCLKYILGIFNSALINFWYRCHFPNVNINPGDFRQIPVRKASESEQRAIVKLVESVTAIKKKDPAADTTALEREIDHHVYALYGLTPDEIAIVEGTGK
jgi:REP element-mobilizing transposase RayT